MLHLKANFLLLHFTDIKYDIRFGFYMHELCVCLNWKIHASESKDSGMTSSEDEMT